MPNFNKTSIVSTNEIQRLMRRNYANTYILDLESFFKNFTTLVTATGVAHYGTPAISTGIIGVDQLNPYGWSTIFESLPWGHDLPGDFEAYTVDIRSRATGIRSLGIKTPQTYVGWGYDIFGFPAPNYDNNWSQLGVYSTGNIPSYLFRGADDTDQYPFVGHGSDVHPKKWLSGPLDLRWDQHRKVWTGNNSVYAGIITKVNIDGGGDPVQPHFYNEITYDAMMYDGLGSGIFVTGVRPSTYQPPSNNYKYYAVPTGSPCIIMHQPVGNRPGFGLFFYEPPYTTQCSNNSDPQAIDATPIVSDTLEGGTGQSTYQLHEILIGNDSFSLEKKKLTSTSGIFLDYDSVPGSLIIRLDPSVDFNVGSGVNYSITAISGLLQPLSITQGGTGSSVKTWVDLSSNQSVSGIKNFTQNVRIANGAATNPSIGFNNFTTYGLFYNSSALHIAASGSDAWAIYPTGTVFNHTLAIRPSGGYEPSFVVRQRRIIGANLLAGSGLGSYSDNIQEWQNSSGIMLSNIDLSGNYRGSGIYLGNTLVNEINIWDSPKSRRFSNYCLPNSTTLIGLGMSLSSVSIGSVNADDGLASWIKLVATATSGNVGSYNGQRLFKLSWLPSYSAIVRTPTGSLNNAFYYVGLYDDASWKFINPRPTGNYIMYRAGGITNQIPNNNWWCVYNSDNNSPQEFDTGIAATGNTIYNFKNIVINGTGIMCFINDKFVGYATGTSVPTGTSALLGLKSAVITHETAPKYLLWSESHLFY